MQDIKLPGRVTLCYILGIIGSGEGLIGSEEDGDGVLEKGQVQVREGGGGGRCRG
jgi:hypothetical protein